MATVIIWDVTSFHVQKEAGILNIGTTPEEVVALVTPDLPAGTYMISYAFQIDYNGTKDKPAFFSMTGTFSDTDPFSDNAPANGDKRNRLYGFPKVWAGGVMTLGLNMHKDAGISQFDCDFVDLMVQRVA